MLTRCPNPVCRLSFEVEAEAEGKNGACPACGQVITFRSLRVILEVERQHAAVQQRRARPSTETAPVVRLTALLENIRSLWNVGSIFRSADGAGFGTLYLCGITGCPPQKAIAKTSLGAEEHVAWQHQVHACEILPALKQAGVQIVALESAPGSLDLSQALAEGALRPPLCLVVGNEVAGVSAETLSAADRVCHLPMQGIKSSLNVAVAFGIAAYQIREYCDRQPRAAPPISEPGEASPITA